MPLVIHGWALLTPFILMGTRYGVVAIELYAVEATHNLKPQGRGYPQPHHKHRALKRIETA